jgi:hypothetical protein
MARLETDPLKLHPLQELSHVLDQRALGNVDLTVDILF